MADYDEELSQIESEVYRLTRQVSGVRTGWSVNTKIYWTRSRRRIRYETLFFRFKKIDHRYWKLINYALT